MSVEAASGCKWTTVLAPIIFLSLLVWTACSYWAIGRNLPTCRIYGVASPVLWIENTDLRLIILLSRGLEAGLCSTMSLLSDHFPRINNLTLAADNFTCRNATDKSFIYSESWCSLLQFMFSGLKGQTTGTGWNCRFSAGTVVANWTSVNKSWRIVALGAVTHH